MVNLKKFFSKEKSNLNSTEEKSNLNSTKEYSSVHPIKRKSPRPAGTGGISEVTKNNKEYYRASYTTGYNKFGTQQRKYFYGESEDIVLEKLNNFIQSFNSNSILPSPEFITLSEWINYYLYKYSCIDCKPSTFEKKQSIYKNYFIHNKKLINKKLKDLRNYDFQHHYNSLIDNGANPITLKNNNKFMQSCLNLAINYGYITINPANNIKFPIPVLPDNIKKTLSLSECKIFINSLDDSTISLFLQFIIFTGLRFGEAAALTWNDINFTDNIIDVNKSLDRVDREDLKLLSRKDFNIVRNKPSHKNVLILQPPKTTYSFRTIPIAEALIDSLEILKARYTRFSSKDIYTDNNLVFGKINGEHLSATTVARNLNKILNTCNITKVTPHEFRHTLATILFEKGVDMKVISTLLGHKPDKKTTDIYAHVTDEMKIDAIKKLNDSLNTK